MSSFFLKSLLCYHLEMIKGQQFGFNQWRRNSNDCGVVELADLPGAYSVKRVLSNKILTKLTRKFNFKDRVWSLPKIQIAFYAYGYK